MSQASAIAWPGAEKKLPQACSTAVLVNAFSRPPTTNAVKMAKTVMVNTLPPRSEYHSARPLATAPGWPWTRDPGLDRWIIRAGGPGNRHAGACSLMGLLLAPLLLLLPLPAPTLTPSPGASA